ncbi:LRR domain containing protein, partial [Trema orientale]
CLFSCNNCRLLPPLGQLSSLKYLEISHFPGVQRISSEFYSSVGSPAAGTKPFRSLEKLHLENMPNLLEWSFIEGEIEGGVFPRLKKLSLTDCQRLKLSLPDYLPSLKKLCIWNCSQLVPLLPRAQQMDAAFPSLEILKLINCFEQESLLEGGLPPSLKQIYILGCWRLTALDEEAFQRLTSLEKLEILDCGFLRCLPRGLPSSLSYLSIKDCRLLKPRVQRETGEDWPIIQNIPNVDICDRISEFTW